MVVGRLLTRSSKDVADSLLPMPSMAESREDGAGPGVGAKNAESGFNGRDVVERGAAAKISTNGGSCKSTLYRQISLKSRLKSLSYNFRKQLRLLKSWVARHLHLWQNLDTVVECILDLAIMCINVTCGKIRAL